MSRKIIVLVLLMLRAYACFASRGFRFGRPKQSLSFQEPVEDMMSISHTKIEPCMGASRGGITTVDSQSDECQVMQKTTVLGMDPELGKHKLSTNKIQLDTQNNKRSMIETQHGNQENKSNGGDESGEVIHVEDYSDPSGNSPIHNHN